MTVRPSAGPSSYFDPTRVDTLDDATAELVRRRQDVLVGDECEVNLSSENQAVIESMQARRNLVRRADSYKTKSLAANLDLLAIVVSASPPCS